MRHSFLILNKSNQKLNSDDDPMDKKPEMVENLIFREFDLFLNISLLLPLNFNDTFAATDTTTYFNIIPSDIFMKKLLSEDI